MSIKRLLAVPIVMLGFFIGWILYLVGSYQHKAKIVKKVYVEDNLEQNIKIVCIEPDWNEA